MSATTADVEALVAAGQFREDQAECLAGVVVYLPPLAARRADIPARVRAFVARVEGPDARPFTTAALERLAAYDWPRNATCASSGTWSSGRWRGAPARRSAGVGGAAKGAHGGPAGDATDNVELRQLVEVLRACDGDTERAA